MKSCEHTRAAVVVVSHAAGRQAGKGIGRGVSMPSDDDDDAVAYVAADDARFVNNKRARRHQWLFVTGALSYDVMAWRTRDVASDASRLLTGS